MSFAKQRSLLAIGALCWGCGASDAAPAPQDASWQVLMQGLPGALLRVFGTRSGEIYAVGADVGGEGPLVYRKTGAEFERLETGAVGSLWWGDEVAADELRMVGDRGVVISHRPSTLSFETQRVPGEPRLFGVWGAAADDVWYVGGDLNTNVGVVLHDDGAAIEDRNDEASAGVVFKVRGFDEGPLWMVGQRGRALQYAEGALTDQSVPMPASLLGLSGVDAGSVYAVGGTVDGVILRRSGDGWQNETPAGAPGLNAVWATSREEAYAAGYNGHVYRRANGVWQEFETPPVYEDIHSLWVDPEGGIWAAGGRLAVDPPTNGVLLYHPPPGPEAP